MLLLFALYRQLYEIMWRKLHFLFVSRRRRIPLFRLLNVTSPSIHYIPNSSSSLVFTHRKDSYVDKCCLQIGHTPAIEAFFMFILFPTMKIISTIRKPYFPHYFMNVYLISYVVRSFIFPCPATGLRSMIWTFASTSLYFIRSSPCSHTRRFLCYNLSLFVSISSVLTFPLLLEIFENWKKNCSIRRS